MKYQSGIIWQKPQDPYEVPRKYQTGFLVLVIRKNARFVNAVAWFPSEDAAHHFATSKEYERKDAHGDYSTRYIVRRYRDLPV